MIAADSVTDKCCAKKEFLRAIAFVQQAERNNLLPMQPLVVQ